jgi:hypothetical protein
MKKYYLAGFCIIVGLLMSSVFAIRVNSIYQAGIPVASQSETEKPQAEQKALAQVFVKVSGNSAILENPSIKSSLTTADALAEEFSYSQSPSTPTTPYILHIRFDSEAINRLLRNAGIPIWGQNRPLIVAWIEYEAPNQAAEIIDSDSASSIQHSLKEYAEQRGLPIILPMMDVTDLNQVNVNDIVTMTIPVLQNASQRYTPDGILVARVFQLQEGYSIQSKMIMGAYQWGWTITGKKLDDVVAALTNNIAEALAGRYAVVVSNTVQTQLTMKVTGIVQQNDLADLMKYMSHLTPVADAEPLHISGTEVMLKISLRSSKQAFIQALSVGQKLRPGSDSTDDLLVYQWNP